MDIQQSFTSGGLRVVTAHLPGFASASVAVFVRAGSRDETLETGGIAHFQEHMAFKGTTTRSALQIAREIEELGSYMNAYTSNEITAYYINGLGSNVPYAVEVLGDVLTHSVHDEAEIDVERGVILQEFAQYQDDPMSVAIDGFNRLAYPDQAVGRPILGVPEFISQVRAHHFRDFLRAHYHTGNMLVIGTGAVDHAGFLDLVETHFAELPRGTASEREQARYGGGLVTEPQRPFQQVSALYGFPTVPDGTLDGMAHKLLADMLGGGMASPLFQEVREKRGLVYGVGAGSSQGRDSGMLVINARTTGDNVVEFFDVSLNELLKMTRHADERDLTRSKNSYLVSYATRREKPFALAEYIAGSLFLWDEIRLPEQRLATVRAITMEHIHEAARQALAGTPTISLVGPAPDVDYAARMAAALA